MSEKIAFIGLGAMGGPMASNIIKKGIKVSVFDIDSERMKKVIKIGGVGCKNINKTVCNSEIVITMLPATQQVKEVILGQNGLNSQLTPGCTIMDMSTIAPKGTDEVKKECDKHKINFVDAPLDAANSEKAPTLAPQSKHDSLDFMAIPFFW